MSIYEPPTAVFVLAYVWQSGNASGGQREVFLSLAETERRLAQLAEAGEVKTPTDVRVFRLSAWESQTFKVAWPEPVALTPVEAV